MLLRFWTWVPFLVENRIFRREFKISNGLTQIYAQNQIFLSKNLRQFESDQWGLWLDFSKRPPLFPITCATVTFFSTYDSLFHRSFDKYSRARLEVPRNNWLNLKNFGWVWWFCDQDCWLLFKFGDFWLNLIISGELELV